MQLCTTERNSLHLGTGQRSDIQQLEYVDVVVGTDICGPLGTGPQIRHAIQAIIV